MEDIDDLIEYIRESGSSEESVDYDYIHNTYTSSTGDDKFTFEVHGSSYRKDQCICDEEIDGEVTVIDSEMLKLEKKAKKAGDATRNTGLWNTLFMEKDLEELKAELLKYKFPKRI
jgi:hypothetical protein